MSEKNAKGYLGEIMNILSKNKAATGLGLGLAGAAVASPIIDDIGDILKEKYRVTNKDVWEALGKAKLYDEMGPALAGIKAKEVMFGDPVEEAVKSIIGTAGPSKEEVFQQIAATPEIKALGEENAKIIFDQLQSLAPKTISKAPSIVLPIIQTALDTGSLAIRPEMAANLIKAEQSLM